MVDIYTPDIPKPQDFPSNSQDQFRQNFNYLIPIGSSSTVGTTGVTRDHAMSLNSGVAGDGTHRQVTFNNLLATPGFSGASSVEYAKTANGGSQLFFNNALGDVQLTTVKTSVPSFSVGPPAQGVSFLPGGVLIQYGLSSGNNVTFPVAFTTLYSVTATPTSFTATPSAITASSTTGFTIGQSSGAPFSAYWIATGLA